MSLIPALVVSAAALAGPVLPPTPAVAAGMAAYDRGDFTTALAILKPIVYDATLDLRPSSDPWAASYLAQMFRRGEGTAPDWPLSCALFDQTVMTVIDGPYPSTEMPPGIRDAAVLRLNAAGDIEWLLKVPPGKRGIIAKPGPIR